MPVTKSHNIAEIRPLCEGSNKVSIDGPPVPKIFDSSIIRYQKLKTLNFNFRCKLVINLQRTCFLTTCGCMFFI